jgi:GGDEF domain-containing protein
MAKLTKSPIVERRVAHGERRRVAEMSPEEMRRALVTSEATGLPNRRAFEEAVRPLAVAMCDVDGLKALNDFAYAAGNALLKAMADALREAGLEAYHDKGDEFLCRGNHIKGLRVNLERARAILRCRTVNVQRPDGKSVSFKGADFSCGVGKDINEAESALKRNKANRESRGEIARGELRGIVIELERPKQIPQESNPSGRLTPSPLFKQPSATK